MTKIVEKHAVCVGLLAILFAATVLRVVSLNSPALWGDEALSLAIARLPAWDLMFEPVDPSPGFYYLLQKGLMQFGLEPWLQRAASLVAGILTVAVAFDIGRQVKDERAGLFLAACVAACQPLVDYSQEARAYALLILFISVSLAGAVRLSERTDRNEWGSLALFWIGGMAGIYTHVVGWFWFGPAMAILLLDRWRSGRWSLVRCLAIGSTTLALVLPELFRLHQFSQSLAGQFDWNWHWGPSAFVGAFSGLMLPASESADTLAGIIVSAIALLIYLGVLWWAIYRFVRAKQALPITGTTLLLLLTLTLFPVWQWIAGFAVTPILSAKTMMPSFVGFWALMIFVIPPSWGRRVWLIPLAFLAETLLLGPVRPEEPWSSLRAALAEQAPADLLLVCPANRGGAFILAIEDRADLADTMAYISFEGLLLQPPTREQDAFEAYADRIWKPLLPYYQSDRRVREVEITYSSLILANVACWPDSKREWEHEYLDAVLEGGRRTAFIDTKESLSRGDTSVARYEWDEPVTRKAILFEPN